MDKYISGILFMFFFVLSFSGWSNKDIDSLENLLKSKDSLEEIQVKQIHNQLASLYEFSDFEKSLEHGNALLTLADSTEDYSSMAIAYHIIGMAYSNLGDKDFALKSFMHGLELLENKESPSKLAVLYYDIATLLMDEGEARDTEAYFIKAIETQKKINNNPYNLASFLMGYASYLHGEKDFNKAIAMHREGLRISNSEKLYDLSASIYGNLAQSYGLQGNKDKSYQLFDSSIVYAEKYTAPLIVAELYEAYAETLYDFGDYKDALMYLNKAMEIDNFHLYKDLVARNLKYRALCLNMLGSTDKAFKIMIEYVELKDSLEDKRSKDDYERYQVLFDTKEKESAIAIKDKDLELQQKEIALLKEQKVNQYYRIFAIITIIFLLILVILVLIKRQRKKVVRLNKAIKHRDVELTNYALNIVEKNKVLKAVKKEFQRLKSNEIDSNKPFDSEEVTAIMLNINNPELNEKLSRIEQSFQFNLAEKYPLLSEREKKVCGLIKLDFSSKEIGELLNVSSRSVDTYRYRIRKKMGLNSKQALSTIVKQL